MSRGLIRLLTLAPRGVPVVAALATGLAGLPALRNEFVTWDDLGMFVGNRDYRGLGPAALRWMWTTFHLGEYMPVTWMTFGADYLVWGLNPYGYHLTNLVLHVASSVLVYFVTLRLLRLAEPSPGGAAVIGAGVSALLFGLHPLRAEPVAWLSARGSVLGGLLALATVVAYLRAVEAGAGETRRRLWMAATLGLFVGTLLARATYVMLPAGLMVLDAYPLRRLPGDPRQWGALSVRHVWREKVPFVLLALAMTVLAFAARGAESAVGGYQRDLLTTLSLSAFGLAYYLGRTVLLGEPIPLYERPAVIQPTDAVFGVSALVAVLVSVLLVLVRRRWPAGLAAWLWYVLMLAPTLGVVPYGLQLVADRYAYVAGASFVVLAGGACQAGWRAWQGGRLRPAVLGTAATLAAVGLVGLGALTWRAVELWRDPGTLWHHAVTAGPPSAVAHSKLGWVYERQGHLPRAIHQYRQAVRIRPDDPWYPRHLARALTYWGRDLVRHGWIEEAVGPLEEAVRLAPRFVEARLTLGVALGSRGRLQEAITQFERALGIDPGSAAAHYYLGSALARANRLEEAEGHLEAALRAEPDHRDAASGLEAVQAQRAAKARPSLGRALLR